MRFRWVPSTSDSVFPFLIGLTEFMLIDTLGPDEIGQWLLLLAVVFSLMNWVAHTTMRRARLDSDNDAYFSTDQRQEKSADLPTARYRTHDVLHTTT